MKFPGVVAILGIVLIYERSQTLVAQRYRLRVGADVSLVETPVSCDDFDYSRFKGKRMYFSVILRNAETVFPQWGESMFAFAKCISNAGGTLAVSILSNENTDGTPTYLRSLRQRLTSLGVESMIDVAYRDESLSDGFMQWIYRLTKLRNASLRNAARFGGLESFDAVLFVNDVLYEAIDVARLAASLSVMRTEGSVNYDKPFVGCACGVDFSRSFYDVWVAKGLSGDSFSHEFPFITPFDGQSTHSLAMMHKSFQVASCWNGVLAMDARTLFSLGADSPFRVFKNKWDARGYLPESGEIRLDEELSIDLAGSESIGPSTEQRLGWFDPPDTLSVLLHAKGDDLKVFPPVEHKSLPTLDRYAQRVHTRSLFRPLVSQPDLPAFLVKFRLSSIGWNNKGEATSIKGVALSRQSVPLGRTLADFECDPAAAEIVVHKDMLRVTNGNYIALVDPRSKVHYKAEDLIANHIDHDFRFYVTALEQWFMTSIFNPNRFTSVGGLLHLPDEQILHSKNGRTDRTQLMMCRFDYSWYFIHEPWVDRFFLALRYLFYIALCHAAFRQFIGPITSHATFGRFIDLVTAPVTHWMKANKLKRVPYD